METKIFDNIMQIVLKEEEIEYFRSFSQDKRIHAGEAEGLAIAKIYDKNLSRNPDKKRGEMEKKP